FRVALLRRLFAFPRRRCDERRRLFSRRLQDLFAFDLRGGENRLPLGLDAAVDVVDGREHAEGLARHDIADETDARLVLAFSRAARRVRDARTAQPDNHAYSGKRGPRRSRSNANASSRSSSEGEAVTVSARGNAKRSSMACAPTRGSNASPSSASSSA